MAITDSWLKANHKKARPKPEEKADGEGLSVRASATGKLVFQMRYRWQGKPARLDLGSYPTMSLKQARVRLIEMKGALAEGRDPRQVMLEQRLVYTDEYTLEKIFMKWYEEYCLREKVSAPEILRSFELHVFPKLGDHAAERIPTYIWSELLEDLRDDVPTIAVRILLNAKQMYRWANRRRLLTSNPLSDFSAKEDLGVVKKTRGRALSDEEIEAFFLALRSTRMYEANKLYVCLCLILGCRNGELRQLRPHEDIDFEQGIWTIPLERSKTRKSSGQIVRRALIPPVIELMKQAMSMSASPDLMFATFSGKEMSDRSTLCWPTRIQIRAERLGRKMDHWTLHDLRKTARTNFSPLVPVHVAELMLGHSIKGVHGVYDYHDYLDEQRAAYTAWYEKLKPISSGFLP